MLPNITSRFFSEESSSQRPRKLMIAGRYFMPNRIANHPLHCFSLSSAYYHYFHSLLTGSADAPPPNHCFTKTAYIYPDNQRISAIYRLPHTGLKHGSYWQELGISSEHHLVCY